MNTQQDQTLARRLLLDFIDRSAAQLPGLIEGCSAADLGWRPTDKANPIGWLAWHIGRVQDDQIAEIGGVAPVWTSQGWQERFGLPYPVDASGYGQTSAEVDRFHAESADLIGYYEAVSAMSRAVIGGITDFDRIIDRSWDPPVSVAVRLVSVVEDVCQHLGQIAYLRGLRESGE